MPKRGRPRIPLTDLNKFPLKYVRLQALSEYCDIPLRTIYYHVDIGALHAVKIGGVLRVPIDDAKAYVSTEARTFA